MTNSTTNSHDAALGMKDSCIIRAVKWLTHKLNLLEEGATPPNWKHILLLLACLFASSCTMTFLFPFLPEMVLHFGYSEYQKGTYGGMVASALFAGRAFVISIMIFRSIFWGWLADRRGRKQVLLMCLLLTGVTAGLFGFANNIIAAIVLRFLCGLTNGIIGTSKAAMYDVSDNTNQALGMTVISLAWGIGLVAGPLAGGILATPCKKWPTFCDSDSLFGTFPFLMPSLFPCIISIVIFILILFKFDETFNVSPNKFELDIQEESKELTKESEHCLRKHLLVNSNESIHKEQPSHNGLSRSVVSLCPEAEMSFSLDEGVLHRQKYMKRHKKQNIQLARSEPELLLIDDKNFATFSKSTSHIQSNKYSAPNAMDAMQEVVSSQPKTSLDLENKVYMNGQHIAEEDFNCQPLLRQKNDENICECCDSCFNLCFTNSSLHRLLRLADVWSTMVLYTVYSFVVIGVDDIFPVFASTSQDLGGLGFGTNEIGVALGVATLPLLCLQIKLYPFLVSKLGIRKTTILMMFVCLVGCQSIPLLRLLVHRPILLWICMVLIQVPYKIALNASFASIALFINNSAPPELAGQANGLANTSTAIGRTLAPIVAGVIFSWSVTYGQFIGAPFDMGFPFFILGTFYGVSLIECVFINPRLDKQKK